MVCPHRRASLALDCYVFVLTLSLSSVFFFCWFSFVADVILAFQNSAETP